jgi:hypothetical protein
MIVALGLLLIGGFFWVLDQVAGNALTSGLAKLCSILSSLALLATLVCFVLAWFRKVPIGISEWIMFLDDKGPAAPAVFAHVAGAFERRRTPADSVRVKRIALPGGGSRDMLEVRYQVFRGYVTAYDFGNDLHIGWTYCWQLSIVRYALLALSNLINGLMGKQTEMHVLARYEPAKTMREALHAAAREGVDVAGSAAEGHLSSTLSVPVDSLAPMPSGGNGLFAT